MSTEHEQVCDDILNNLAFIVASGADPRETNRAGFIRVRLHGSLRQRQRLSFIEEAAERQAAVNRLEAKAEGAQVEPEIQREAAAARAAERRSYLDGEL